MDEGNTESVLPEKLTVTMGFSSRNFAFLLHLAVLAMKAVTYVISNVKKKLLHV